MKHQTSLASRAHSRSSWRTCSSRHLSWKKCKVTCTDDQQEDIGFHKGGKFLELNFLVWELSYSWSNQVVKVILTEGQFVRGLALNETHKNAILYWSYYPLTQTQIPNLTLPHHTYFKWKRKKGSNHSPYQWYSPQQENMLLVWRLQVNTFWYRHAHRK